MYAPDLSRPVILPRGTVTRTITVYDGASEASGVTGTYALFDRAGTSVASGSVSSGSVTITVPSDLTLGTGAYEVWTIASPTGIGAVQRPVIVSRSLDSRWNLVGHAQIIAARSWLAQAFPSGRTSWELHCAAASTEVYAMLVDRTRWASEIAYDLWDPSPLARPALFRALELIHRDAAALTGATQFEAEAARLAREFADWWERAALTWDSDGDQDRDTVAEAPGGVGFPRSPPSGVR